MVASVDEPVAFRLTAAKCHPCWCRAYWRCFADLFLWVSCLHEVENDIWKCMKRNSVMEPHNCSHEGGTSDQREMIQRADSPVSSCVSMKSDVFMEEFPESTSGHLYSDLMLQTKRKDIKPSPVSSCVSMKSNMSKGEPPKFCSGPEPSGPNQSQRAESSLLSCPYVKRKCSLRKLSGSADSVLQTQSLPSPVPSSVPEKITVSTDEHPKLCSGSVPSDLNILIRKVHSDMITLLNECVTDVTNKRIQIPTSVAPSLNFMKSDHSLGEPEKFSSEAVDFVSMHHCKEAALQTKTLLKMTKTLQYDSHKPRDAALQNVLKRHKLIMKNKYESLFECVKTQENKTLLNRIYTQLYILEGESEDLNKEHEVLQIEKKPWKHLEDTPINCNGIFELSLKFDGQDQDRDIRTVLTKGIAGIGKTVSVQKFILDWAEDKANQDVDLMFVLPFRELNLIKNDQYSLHGLLCAFHPELKDLKPDIYDVHRAVFIFDGLDESRIQLNFSKSEKVSDITTSSPVDVLMTSLIKGELLPSAQIWITSRPAAANQIPPQYISRVTEIQGFNDRQKEEYFYKKVCNQDQAKKIIAHVKKVRSLHIMCHIPVFCFISATVLQKIFNSDIPKTLTEMYIHFLLIQTNMKSQKYEESRVRDPKELLESNRTVILKLAELAFRQLMKGNVMFYEEDLRECGIDVTEASVYSGICTEIFREESVLDQRNVYSFVHLSFQEFLAAFFVFHCFVNKKMEPLIFFKPQYREWAENVALEELLEGAMHKALQSKNGHLDLFLRFLLGISLEANQKLLHGLLMHTQKSSESIDKMIRCIQKQIKGEEEVGLEMSVMMEIWSQMMEKMKQRKCLTTDRSMNLFFCLTEMNDQSLSREIQEYLKSEKHSGQKLSPGQCSALACMLLISDQVIDEFELKKYNTSEEGYLRLIPAVSNCRKALLVDCNLSMNVCNVLTSVLQSANSSLKELDLSKNDLQDSGVEVLCDGLKSLHCKLQTLRLAECNLTTNSCKTFCLILKSESSCLTELDVRNNNLQDSGVELLYDGLQSSYCKLEILRIAGCNLTKKSCEILCLVLELANSLLKELDLGNNNLQDSGVELLSAGLGNLNCKLQKLILTYCNLTMNSCKTLCYTLKFAKSLKEIDLSNNNLQDLGVELLSSGLKSKHCQLVILRLGLCNLTLDSCKMLASVLQSANSSLTELELSKNDLQDSGVAHLCAGLQSSYCKLHILRLSGCMITEEGCSSLASVLVSNPSHLKELDLTYNHPEESGIKLLSARLEDPHCALNTLRVEHSGKIRIKLGLRKYACNLTLDPNTAHTCLFLCEGNRKVVCVREQQPYSDHPERFDWWEQVMCREELNERCYWEAEYSGRVEIAVTHKSIIRKGDGDGCAFGFNDKSWKLFCTSISYTAWYNKKRINIPPPPYSSNRVGVYLDRAAGTLSFYSVSTDTNTLTHLHTFHSMFTEPLYAGFASFYGSWVCVLD